eukprot:m.120619 g.120619  ORF g.120619 m.120619 type:complete len:81 (+) comp15499_c0_seq6:40-282(+)
MVQLMEAFFLILLQFICSHNSMMEMDKKVLCAIDTNLRHKALERGIQVMEKFQTSTQTLLFHAAVSRAKLALQAAATEDQ